MPAPLRLVFAGTPEFAVPALEAVLASGHALCAVYTQPDRPAGRGRQLQASPVKRRALAAGIEVRQPPTLRDADAREALAALRPDLMVVVAYGLILPRAVLAIPRHGCWNIHASLLPRWRGAAPIQRAIMAGDKETGVMVMQMEEGLDTGPVLLAERVEIGPEETAGSLHDRLSHIGASLMVRALSALSRGGLAPTPQPETGVTYAKKIEKAEARIDWSRPAKELDCIIRGLTPFPGAFFELGEGRNATRIKVLRAKPLAKSGKPGEVLSTLGSIVVACGQGALEISELQRAGKSPMFARDFLRGFPLEPGEILA